MPAIWMRTISSSTTPLARSIAARRWRITNTALHTIAQDLVALRAIPGVRFAASTNMVPFGDSSWNTDVSTKFEDTNGSSAGVYMGSADLLEDLRWIYLRSQEAAITWVMAAQAAKAPKLRNARILTG